MASLKIKDNRPRMSLFGLWGVFGFALILLQAIFRLFPRAVESIQDYEWGAIHWLSFIFSIVFMGISEGYKGFQKQVAPRAVARAATLNLDSSWLKKILAPFFCMSLFCATRKRLIISWSVYTGIVLLILIVRQVPQPFRGIIDAGVVFGLSWGIVALGANLIAIYCGKPTVDPELPG